MFFFWGGATLAPTSHLYCLYSTCTAVDLCGDGFGSHTHTHTHTLPLPDRSVHKQSNSRHNTFVGLRVQQLCESRGGRPGLPVLMSLTVSVDVKQH